MMENVKMEPEKRLANFRLDVKLIERVRKAAPTMTIAVEQGLELWLERERRRKGLPKQKPPAARRIEQYRGAR
jgi:hypothetical protein